MNPQTHLIITVDVETSFYRKSPLNFDERVYGNIDGEYYGVPKIIELCNKHKQRATFFVNVYEQKLFGEEKLKQLCQEIDTAGHDVQLHTHPICAYDRNRGYLTDYSLREQIDIIADGKALLEKWIEKAPVAHRAGDFAANLDTLEALRRNNILIDCSLFHNWELCQLNHLLPNLNQPFLYNQVLEIPITVFSQFKCLPCYRALDLDADSLLELKRVLKQCVRLGHRVVVLMLHSFSFLKWNSERTMHWPDFSDLNKFDKLLEYLTLHPEFKIITMEQLAAISLANQKAIMNSLDSEWQATTVPTTGFPTTLHRVLLNANDLEVNHAAAVLFKSLRASLPWHHSWGGRMRRRESVRT